MNSPLKYKEIVEGGAGYSLDQTFCVGAADGRMTLGNRSHSRIPQAFLVSHFWIPLKSKNS